MKTDVIIFASVLSAVSRLCTTAVHQSISASDCVCVCWWCSWPVLLGLKLSHVFCGLSGRLKVWKALWSLCQLRCVQRQWSLLASRWVLPLAAMCMFTYMQWILCIFYLWH